MARPTQHRTIIKRFRVNAAEDARLQADAAEATKGDESALIRQKLFSGQPLVTGKGMSRFDLRKCLELTSIIQVRLKGVDSYADSYIQQLADTIYKALQDDH